MSFNRDRYLRRREAGFTFIEVVIALAVMASAAGIIIGMQGAALRRTARDFNAQQAMLVARRIMASIEAVDPKNFNIQSQDNQPVSSVLQSLGITSQSDQADSASLSQLSASLTVEEWPIPLLQGTGLMNKIILRIFWGPGIDEALEVIYLQPNLLVSP